MGSRGCIGELAPQFLGLHADGRRMDVSGGKGDMVKQPLVSSEWHSVSFNESSGPEVEYCFKLVERNDCLDSQSSLFGSKDVSVETRTLELSLCGLSKYVDSDANADEARPLGNYSDGLKKDCSYISMEAVDSSNGVKEVRVSFHGMDDSRKAGKENGLSRSANHDLAYGDDGCLSIVSQFRSFLSPKISCRGLVAGDSEHTMFEGLGTILHSFKTPLASSKDESITKTHNQPENKTPLSGGLSKSPSVGCNESSRRAVFEARDIQARCDALPLAHYRPDCPVWCSREQEQRRDGATMAPNPNGHCKKPPKPPKPPRHPGRSTSLDAAALAAAKAAAARKKAMKQAAAKRRARVSAPPNSGGTPLIALVLTLGFGVLMVFQGLFVQSNATYGDSDRTFVDVPSDQFGDLSLEKSNSYGLPYQIDPELQSSSEVVDPGKADMVISIALYKSMQELESSRSSSQVSGRTASSW